jgi:hypothetical protein
LSLIIAANPTTLAFVGKYRAAYADFANIADWMNSWIGVLMLLCTNFNCRLFGV